MLSRIPVRSSHAVRIASSPFQSPIILNAKPFLITGAVRCASVLSNLADVPTSYHKRKRLGRGPASGKGKTSGRGHKGQKQHGKVPAGFNGGQTPLHVFQGRRGFKNVLKKEMTILNLSVLQHWINTGRIDASKPISFKELLSTRCVHGIKDGVKLLAGGKETFKTPINIVVTRASRQAIDAVEAAGGVVTTRFTTHDGIKSLTNPRYFHEFKPDRKIWEPPNVEAEQSTEALSEDLSNLALIPRARRRMPDAYSRSDLEYYRDPSHRGYLAHTLKVGEWPSLVFKAPREISPEQAAMYAKKKKRGAAQDENRLF